MKRCFAPLIMLVLFGFVMPVAAQDACGDAPSPRLTLGHGNVVAGQGPLNVYQDAGQGQVRGVVTEDDEWFQIISGPQCVDGVNWWQIDTLDFGSGWLTETRDGEYVVEPYVFVPVTPVPIDVPLTPPVISNPDVPLPTVVPVTDMPTLDNAFAGWDWETFLASTYYEDVPDPLELVLPEAYAGDLPEPPVDLSTVYFVQDANLNQAQLALLAQNGFVVVPGTAAQFDELYQRAGWSHTEGKGDFITTDALLHSLFLVYQNTLMFLEMESFYGQVVNVVAGGYEAAEAQALEAVGTPMEIPARNAALYYAIALILLSDGEQFYVQGYQSEPAFKEGDRFPSQVLAAADQTILAEAQPIVEMIYQAEGRLDVPFLENYQEDFSQYRVRGYYAGNKLLEAYFRGMMWLGRITFTAKSETDTLSGLLILRALRNAEGAYADWQSVADTLTFLVGPMDDFSPADYMPLAEQVFGEEIPLNELARVDRLTAFREEVSKLPGPRINSIPLPLGTQAESVDELTRGFRLFGQRFTFDAYIMQQLIYPEVGTASEARALPLGLDITAVLGSDIAFALADEAGATAYANYTEHVAALREEVNGLDSDAWTENLYGGWLWALQPLLVRDSALIPPMMQTDAWKRKDILTSLGSWTELKHATLLYSEQAYGGLGGGGVEPPVISYSYVEPNPLVFARIALVSTLLRDGLLERGLVEEGGYNDRLDSMREALESLSVLSAQLTEMACKEVAGEPLTHDEAYFLQEYFGSRLWNVRYAAELWLTDPPETVALVADVASNPDAGTVLQVGIGNVDTIYVITDSPYGLQLTRGGVFSYYEFEQNIDQRMTDEEWREQVAKGQVPARPSWMEDYFSD